MKLSMVVPCFNEAENVAAFQKAAIEAFSGCNYDFELIFVDDGSKDATLHELRKLHCAQLCPVKVVSFSRNFGKEAAIFAGLKHTSGEFVALIDADLQQRPEIVRDMVQILDEHSEYDVVAAYQDRRSEGAVLKFFKKTFYSIINSLSDVALKSDASDFRTFRRSVAESILSLGESHRFSKGIFAWVGYQTCYIPYVACARAAGTSKWNFWKLFNYAIDGIISYSTKPLRFASFLGIISSASSILYFAIILLRKLILGVSIPTNAVMIILLLLLGGIQLFCLGILGEYVGRTFMQSKDRPIYITKEILE